MDECIASGTPANWQDGDDVIILPAVSNEDAEARYPDGWKNLLPSIRVAPQPGSARASECEAELVRS